MAKKFFSVLTVFVMLFCIFSLTAFAYTGGPLDDSSTTYSYGGEVIFDSTNTTPTPTVVQNYDALNITKDPGGETKKSGDSCVFASAADGADTVKWYMISPNGKTYLVSDIPTLFSGVTYTTESINGYDRLILNNVTSDMSGYRFYAAYTSGDITMNTAGATLTVEGTIAATPAPTPTPTIAPTPTPTPVTGVQSTNVNNGGVTSGNVYSSGNTSTGTGSLMGTNTNNYNENTSIGSDGNASEPAAGSYVQTSTTVENSRGKSHIGAYILAAVAGLVIVGSVLIMALYMKGKISLGKFEKFLGGTSNNNNYDGEDFYNPDDYDDTMNT